jgi:hypothetical protein
MMPGREVDTARLIVKLRNFNFRSCTFMQKKALSAATIPIAANMINRL